MLEPSQPLESEVESYLVRRVQALGGRCLKFSTPGTAGACDRLVLLPRGGVAFIELKRFGHVPDKMQEKFIREMRMLGHVAGWADTPEGIDRLLEQIEFSRLLRAGGND